ncbi:hypothetical protein SAMN05421740_104228 [Parapedobacter koreensis]|uniref:Uncharacterized protein n=1 Tax=Parapedobacter koreensis TaxID=332977 RepID=A0A1H7P693_9SPHI|nr:hypothetical protein SAMN05421740_104228 [Parapedobacter koreensis]
MTSPCGGLSEVLRSTVGLFRCPGLQIHLAAAPRRPIVCFGMVHGDTAGNRPPHICGLPRSAQALALSGAAFTVNFGVSIRRFFLSTANKICGQLFPFIGLNAYLYTITEQTICEQKGERFFKRIFNYLIDSYLRSCGIVLPPRPTKEALSP